MSDNKSDDKSVLTLMSGLVIEYDPVTDEYIIFRTYGGWHPEHVANITSDDAHLLQVFLAVGQGVADAKAGRVKSFSTHPTRPQPLEKPYKMYEPLHPGKILEDLLQCSNTSVEDLARDICTNPYDVQRVIDGTKRINSIMAQKLAKYFKTSGGFWYNLQDNYDER